MGEKKRLPPHIDSAQANHIPPYHIMHPSRKAYVEEEVSSHVPRNHRTVFTHLPQPETTTRANRDARRRLTSVD